MKNQVNWGIIGSCGIAKRRMIPAMLKSENTRLVALMDKNSLQLEKIANEFGVESFCTNEDELLENPEVEAVYIASPVSHHFQQAKKVMEAGKHLLVEKPITLNYRQAQQLIEIQQNTGVNASSAMVMRFHQGHREVKGLINEGGLGQIVSCRAQLTCWFPELGNNWRQSLKTSGGGALMDMGIHCIDLLSYLTGQRAVKVGGLIDTKTFGYEVEDSASVLLQLEGGANCYIDTYNNIPDSAANNFLEIYGTKGSVIAKGTIGQEGGGEITLTISDQNRGYNSLQQRQKNESKTLDFGACDPFERQIYSCSKRILQQKAPEVSLAEGAEGLRVIETAYKAAKEGRFLEL